VYSFIDLQLFGDDPPKTDPPKTDPPKTDPPKDEGKGHDAEWEKWGQKVLGAIEDLGKKITPQGSGSQGTQGQGRGQAQGSVTVVVPPGPMGDQDKPKPKKGFLSRMVDSLYQ
jgi:hypothetical protein